MARPPELHDAVGEAIKAIDEASTVWEAELIASELLGRDWIPLPLGRAVMIDVHLRLVADEAARFGGHGRTLQAVLGHLTDNPVTQGQVNLASRALGILQPWVPLLDSVALVQAGEVPGQIALQFGYGDFDEHWLILTVEDGMVQRIDVTSQAPGIPPVDPVDLAPRLATLMAHTTQRYRELRDPDAVNGRWALLTSRVRTCLPPVLSLDSLTAEGVRSLANRYGRLKVTRRLATDNDVAVEDLRTLVWPVIHFESRQCPGGWTVESVERFYSERAPQINFHGREELLGQVVITYLTWRMGKLGYQPLVQAASEAHLRYLEQL